MSDVNLKDWAVPAMLALFLGWQAQTGQNTTNGAVTADQMDRVLGRLSTIEADLKANTKDRFTSSMADRVEAENAEARDRLHNLIDRNATKISEIEVSLGIIQAKNFER